MDLNTFYKRKGYSTSILDIPVKSYDDAKELEQLVKEAERNNCGFERLYISSSDIVCKAIDEEKKQTALITASTNDVDRDNEVVDVKGLSLKQFSKSPVILWGHKYDMPPVARSLWTKPDGDSLKSLIEFAKKPADWSDNTPWFPSELFALAQQGILKGVSIGFLALEASSPTEKEIKARPELAGVRKMIRKSMLLEISLVSVGSNPKALIESVSKGLVAEDIYERLGLTRPVIEEPDVWEWETKDFAPVEQPKIIVPSRADVLNKILNSKAK